MIAYIKLYCFFLSRCMIRHSPVQCHVGAPPPPSPGNSPERSGPFSRPMPVPSRKSIIGIKGERRKESRLKTNASPGASRSGFSPFFVCVNYVRKLWKFTSLNCCYPVSGTACGNAIIPFCAWICPDSIVPFCCLCDRLRCPPRNGRSPVRGPFPEAWTVAGRLSIRWRTVIVPMEGKETLT